jgi:methanethiol S-methyltransferase
MLLKRAAAVAFGLVAYGASMAAIVYLIGFVGDLPLPRTVNRGAGPLGPPLVVNTLLIVLFGVQHSVMARPGFKAVLARILPPQLERAAFGLAASITLALLFWLWRPIPLVVWDLGGTGVGVALGVLFWAAWATAIAATFALSHPHLFGLTQVGDYLRMRKEQPPQLRTPAMYRVVRHPMTAALIVAFWATPRMSVGHLILALGMTVYSLVGTVLEERDLIRTFGERYRAYRREVPALVPGWSRVVRRPRGAAAGTAAVVALVAVGAWAASTGARSGEATSQEPVAGWEEGATGGAASRVHEMLPGARGGEDLEASFEVGGHERRALIHLPEGLSPGAPVVIAYHGSGGSPERFRHFLGAELERLAVEQGFILAYPEAFQGSWNECRIEASSVVRGLGVDDVAFTRRLIAHLVRIHRVDPAQVFVLGFSGGGQMAYRLVLEAPGVVAGAAVFAANLPREDHSACQAAGSPPPLVLAAGSADLINPYRGGWAISPTGVPLGRVRSAEASALHFAEDGAEVHRTGSNGTPPGGLAVEHRTWIRGGCPVARLTTLRHGGHSVPGPAGRFPRSLGRTDAAFPGVAEAMGFLLQARACLRSGGEPDA